MLTLIYPIIKMLVIAVVMAVILLMVLRLIFNYTDPNPFGALGRFAASLKRYTDRIVQPPAQFLARVGMNTKLAPFLTILVFCIFGYFILELSQTLLFTIDGVAASLLSGNIVKLAGFLIYGFLGLLSLAIIMRIVFSWMMREINPVLRFLTRMTDPILLPVRRIMPPVMMFDISPMIVIFILGFLQKVVAGVLLI